jgi:transcription-repair coupling factor (superfamily II helicase)
MKVHLPAGTSSWCWVLRDVERPLLAVVPDQYRLSEFVSDWKVLFPLEEIHILSEIPLTEEHLRSEATRIERGSAVEKWNATGGCIVTTPSAILAPLSLPSAGVEIDVGLALERDRFLEWAAGSGYSRSDLVWQEGQYVSRGSIVDIFDPSYRLPLRIEFFDDRIESIHLFDPESQRSRSPVGLTRILALTGGIVKRLDEMLHPDTGIILFEPPALERSVEAYQWIWNRMADDGGADPLISWEEELGRLSGHRRTSVTRIVQGSDLRIPVMEVQSFKGRLEAAESVVRGWLEEDFEITLYSSSELLLQWASEIGITPREGALSKGFVDRSEKKVFLSDSDLVGVTPASREGRVSRVPPREWEERIGELDFVIHEDYGIARNLGIERVTSDGMDRDCLVLLFAENRRLLLPLVQLYKITPYPAFSGEDPPLDSLRGTVWKKASLKAREKAREAARQILALYAERETSRKEPLPPDGELVEKFESAFPFEETSDQLSAIRSIKMDMEDHLPMDRLLVGDVGFGKTEVAFRAAVKAAEAGRQTAFLVPTTLLAFQHFESFSARITGLPVRAEVLSRFVSRKRQEEIKVDIEKGLVDVVFGTHRLLQGDLKFRRLGLIVIDEEHRFGVLHKERLKKLDPSIDVLSISATPIPRTLHMALGGISHISMISSPPYRRQPVMTYVGPWRDDLFREAVLKESARGGQVFFVHNRIETIDAVAARTRSTFPDLRVDVVHGRMEEKKLEEAMIKFTRRETDLLVCTTIIESGLDLPGANTLIVDNAQDLGLAQMYQLRGRVGRREEQAFAFFFYPPDRVMPYEALERLEAIAGLSDRGGGLALAKRDMEIRGGGQLIGTRQHGHIDRVGFNAYFKMLEEEITSESGGEPAQGVRMEIRIPVILPSSYVPQSSVRIALFRRLLRVEGVGEVLELEKEIRERFGPIPRSVAFMLASAKVRSTGRRNGLQYVHCALEETRAGGDPLKLRELASGKAGWMLTSSGILTGPGGYRGMVELAEMLEASHLGEAWGDK